MHTFENHDFPSRERAERHQANAAAGKFNDGMSEYYARGIEPVVLKLHHIDGRVEEVTVYRSRLEVYSG